MLLSKQFAFVASIMCDINLDSVWDDAGSFNVAAADNCRCHWSLLV